MRSDDLVRIYFSVFPMRFMRYHAFRVEQFVKAAARECDRAGRRLIDIGSHNSPYRKHFTKVEYFSQDVRQSPDNTVDYVCDIQEGSGDIPAESFDYALCTQVLEHLSQPHKAFAEFYRILKPGGKIYLTTHQAFEEHMIPHDYFRFTRYGLRFLIESSGFKLTHISPHGGVFHVISYLLGTLPIRLIFKGRNTFGYYAYVSLFSLPILFLNFACYLLDYLDRDPELTINYECVFEKPA